MKAKVDVPARPAHDYCEAVTRIEALQAAESGEIDTGSRSKFLTHGKQAERAIVLFHGMTNSPRQFEQLGKQFYERGYNVLIPRAPYHGYADRMTPAMAELTAEKLLAYAAEAVDIGQGLGTHLTVTGLSMGGTLAGWAAQYRHDVERSVLLAPCFGLKVIPGRLTTLSTRLALLFPNLFLWWDPRTREKVAGPAHAYPRFCTRALAELLRLATTILADARHSPPAADEIVVVTNANDDTVNNSATDRLVRTWRGHGSRLRTHHFGSADRLIHDLIDPAQPDQKVAFVYPILIDLIEGQPLSSISRPG